MRSYIVAYMRNAYVRIHFSSENGDWIHIPDCKIERRNGMEGDVVLFLRNKL